MYHFESRIRYSELDQSGKLSMEALLNYFQDSSTFHSEDIGMGIKYLTDRKLAWVMSYWQVLIGRFPGLGERIQIGTAPYEFRGVLGYRNFLMETPDKERLACANTIWTLMDMEHMLPVKPPEEMKKAYVLEEKLSMPYAPRKILLPGTGGKRLEPFLVGQCHMDTNRHVNNAQYIKIAMEYVPPLSVFSQLRAEYKRQVRAGDWITPEVFSPRDGIWIVVLHTEDQMPCCIAEFTAEGCTDAEPEDELS